MQKAKKRPNSIKRNKDEMKVFGKKMSTLVEKTTTLELNHMKSKGVN
jgi:hypothetical protein